MADRPLTKTTTNTTDDRPWERLYGPPRAGDEVRWDHGILYVRRAVQKLPPEHDGVVLIPADGRKTLTTVDGQIFRRLTFTKELFVWYGPNLAAMPGTAIIQITSTERLTPGTWKVEEK